MPLLGPNAEDLRKLSNEATQIVNQKFLITTAAVTVFGFLAAQLLAVQSSLAAPGAAAAGQAGAGELGWASFFGPILLNLFLLVLMFYSTILAGMLRIITTYLIETKASGWESDWGRYRAMGHLGYTRAQAVVFLFLALIASGFPFAFALIREVPMRPLGGLAAHSAVSAFTLLAIVLLGVVGWPSLEARPDQRWRVLNRE